MYNLQSILTYCKKASAENWPYVRGANGEKLTETLLKKLLSYQSSTSQYGYSHFFGRNLIGKYGADCSGLIVGAVRSQNASFGDRNADTWYRKCTIKGKFSSSIKVVPGMLLFNGTDSKKNHVGIAVSVTQSVEEKSTKDGCVTTNIATRGWKYYGYSDVFDYGTVVTPVVESKKLFSNYSSVIATSPSVNIKEVQEALTKVKNGRYKAIVGSVDGIYGIKTLAAILVFQHENGIKVDGMFGELSKKKAEQLI